jgi:hypothetical protein
MLNSKETLVWLMLESPDISDMAKDEPGPILRASFPNKGSWQPQTREDFQITRLQASFDLPLEASEEGTAYID